MMINLNLPQSLQQQLSLANRILCNGIVDVDDDEHQPQSGPRSEDLEATILQMIHNFQEGIYNIYIIITAGVGQAGVF